ncbi:L-seryl-tRNA(Sec) selenium transferase [Olsenella profusa]|uniref:L-seryl-tRNA(Sec) selenium transferase n=1 Tax=Olsenella profusa F0195 TaxID=1125712 RepID=U2UVS8_9ACTN|nr:L-seryl-tRNA(Sec) selenium transferase [Olsenella profusa]ERL07217.1 L-seryl-tRNA(Sec) selenium transferase [Olsenella profusa F0195]
MVDHNLLRRIPKMDVVLGQECIAQLLTEASPEQVKAFVRDELEGLRRRVLAGEVTSVSEPDDLCEVIARDFKRRGPYHLRRVINATGIVLHTNLGRAPLGREVAEHVADVASGYSNLEYDLDAGERGSRYAHLERLICELTGAEDAMVVNNNAGGVFLMLDTLCKGEGVAVSRGELVEIGGSFRVPDIMARSGARLVEVGTTNKTHPTDYERAMAEQGVTTLLKVHTSNFVMRGFTESVSVTELADLARPSGALVLYDVGSTFLFPGEAFGIPGAQTVRGALSEGADLVSFSGDKLLGSAQGGLIVGRRALIERIKKNPLTRMLRIDKLSLAALEMTLQLSRSERSAKEQVPTLRMLAMTREDCHRRARALAEALETGVPTAEVEEVELEDEAGGGSLPGVELPGAGVAVSLPGLSARELELRLRGSATPIIVRVKDGRVCLSARTLLSGDVEEVIPVLADIAQGVERP